MYEYDFSTLSPYDFETLVRDLLTRQTGLHFQSFRRGKDKGVDLRYAGADANPQVVAQCKHFYRSKFTDLLKAARIEAEKVKKLAPQRYIFATSQDLSVQNVDELFAILSPYCVTKDDILTRSTLNAILREHPDIEKKHFKLWMTSTVVLERVLHNSVFAQSEIERDSVVRNLAVFVPCLAVSRAQQILDDVHTCIISGIPGIGKTTLARILCAEFLANDWEVIKVFRDIREGLDVLKSNPDAKQVFYYDDFLGQISIGDKLSKNEDHLLLQMIDAIKRSPNKRFILTTREYILAQAKQRYEVLNRKNFNVESCLLALDDYSALDKARILANHLFFHQVPQEHIEALISSDSCKEIVSHRNYSPRLVEWMTNYTRVASIDPHSYPRVFIGVLDNPMELWEHAFTYQISVASRNLLLTLAACGAEVTLDDLRLAFNAFHTRRADQYRFSSSPWDFNSALKELEGNFIRTTKYQSAVTVQYHNPSVADFVSHYLRANVIEVADVLRGSIFFEQLIRIVQFMTVESDRAGSKARLNSLERDILSLFERALGAPSISLQSINYGAGRHDVTIRPLDISSRIREGIELCSRFESLELKASIETVCQSFFANIGNSKPCVTGVAPLLDELGEVKFIKPDVLTLWKRQALGLMLATPTALDEAVSASQWIKMNKCLLTDDQFEEYSERLYTFLIDEVKYLLSDEDDSDTLDEICSDLMSIESALDFDLSEERKRFEEKSNDRRHQRDENDERVEWRGQERRDSMDDLLDIESVFDSLRA